MIMTNWYFIFLIRIAIFLEILIVTDIKWHRFKALLNSLYNCLFLNLNEYFSEIAFESLRY